MKGYRREYPCFSLCGLNCGLCPIHHMNNGCPGCGGGEGNQPCAIIRCSREHGEIEYCGMCPEYPCQRYNELTEHDSFITHRNMLKDYQKAKQMGMYAYQAELEAKIELLRELLDQYNDGRRKSFFCAAVNLLELQDIQDAVERIRSGIPGEITIKEKAARAVKILQDMADSRNVDLKLRKKKK